MANFFTLCAGPKSSLASVPPQSSSTSAPQKNSVRASSKSTSTKSALPASHKPSATGSRASSSDIQTSSSHNKVPKIKKSTSASAASTSAPRRQSISTSQGQSKSKRPRSPSLSESPPPAKKRQLDNDISSHIWSLFGKDRKKYTSRDVLSDDEDMEVDATFLEREETIRSVIFSRIQFHFALGAKLHLNRSVLGSLTRRICLKLRKNAAVLRRRRGKHERVAIDLFPLDFSSSLCLFFGLLDALLVDGRWTESFLSKHLTHTPRRSGRLNVLIKSLMAWSGIFLVFSCLFRLLVLSFSLHNSFLYFSSFTHL